MPSNRARNHDPDGAPQGLRTTERVIILAGGVVLGALAAVTARRRRPARPDKDGEAPEVCTDTAPPRPSAFPQASSLSARHQHEPSEVNLAAFGLVLLLLAVAAFIIHTALWQLAKSPGPAAIDAATQWRPAADTPGAQGEHVPLLQLSPQRDLEEFRAREREELHRTTGANRLSIEQAMAAIAERGDPKWAAAGGSNQTLSPLELQQRRPLEAARRTP